MRPRHYFECWHDHLACAVLEVERLRIVNQRQADGWADTHRDLTRARDENAELRRRLGEVGA